MWVAVAAVLLGAPRAGADSGKVSGTMIVNGTKVPIQHVMAVTYDTPSPGRLISAMVSDKPVDPKAFAEFGILEDYLVLDVKSTSPRLVGRIRTKEPVVELNTEKVGLDLTFDVPVAALGK